MVFQVIKELLTEVGNALIQSDVNIKMVLQLRTNLQKSLSLENISSGTDKRTYITKVCILGVTFYAVLTPLKCVFNELCALLDPGVKPYKPQKGKTNVVMMVGLQGSGKTTTIAKYANYYKRRGFKPGLICADTFRAGAFDQLKQNAEAIRVPYYGSYTERDPVKIAQEGLEIFKNEKLDLIIVDTSGRHKQESALFEEMKQISETVNPNQIIFIMDGSIGQAAFDQAEAFKNSVEVGAVIITKLDGNAKGGGALSAVAATKSPIIFLGNGEHFENLEEFEPEPYVSKLLGWGDWKGLIETIKNVIPPDSGKNILQDGKFTLRDMYEQFETMLKMGPLNQVMEKIPGFSQLLQGKGDVGTQKIKRYMVIMDSMTEKELDNPKIINQSRMARIARGSGSSITEVNELIKQHKTFENVVKTGFKGMKGGRGGANQVANMVPPHLLKQMGGANALNNLMKQMGGGLGNFFK